MSARQPPRPARLLWRVWYRLERWEVALETLATRFIDPVGLFRPAGRWERAYRWWFWDGPGGWVVRRANRAEERWMGVRYARQTRRRESIAGRSGPWRGETR